jgi:hypothetical protein
MAAVMQRMISTASTISTPLGQGFMRHLQRGLTPQQVAQRFVPLQVPPNDDDAKVVRYID